MSTVPVDSGIPTSTKRNSKMAASQSLDHLLNFTLPPRQHQQYQNHPRRRKAGTNAAVWNRERFVNAQYRFLMNPNGDYTVHFADPDIYFHWPDILQVIVPRKSPAASAVNENIKSEDEHAVCPICLSPPTAPRMTRCGHIFCFPCILHYFNTSDTVKSARCPICLDTVVERQLKAVKWVDTPTSAEDDEEGVPTASSSSAIADNGLASRPRPGSTLRMRLIQRPQITTMALPRSNTWPSDILQPYQAPFHFLPDVYYFARFMLATPAALISDLAHDLDDLATERRMLTSMKDDLGVAFIDAADAKVRHQMEKAAALENPHLQRSIDAAHHALQQIEERAARSEAKAKEREDTSRILPSEDVPEEFLSARSSGYAAETALAQPQPAVAPTRDPKRRKNVNPPPPTSSYYYYQAASGLPIFLHPLDIRILRNHFSNYADFPDTITVRVEEYHESTVNDELRKRCKYLAHLPTGADVAFIAADLEGVVGKAGLKPFERPLTARHKRRADAARKDETARVRAEERERERLLQNWNELTRHSVDSYISPSAPRASSPIPDFNDFPGPDEEPRPQTQQSSGAWGARSFASAAQHPNSGDRIVPQRQTRRPTGQDRDAVDPDAWDLDLEFHEGDQRAGRGGGRKKKNNRMVVLGGGGGRRR